MESSGHSRFLAELLAGLAAMLVAVPAAIAFGVTVYSAADAGLASAGALAGLVGAFVLGITAPLVGRNGGFISAPCAPAAAVLAGLAVQLGSQGGHSSDHVLALLSLAACLAAILQTAFGAARLGRVVKYMPYQVVTGYLSGVAMIIALSQLPKLLGVPGGTSTLLAAVQPSLWTMSAVVVGLVSMLAMLVARRITAAVPAAVIALAAGVLTYQLAALFDPGLAVLTDNPLLIGPLDLSGSLLGAASVRVGGLAQVRASDVGVVFATALTLAVLLSVDTLKTGVVLDAITYRRHNSNRELVAQGIANFASFAAGGLPGAATMGPTLMNLTSGGRQVLSSLSAGLFALLVYLALGELVAWVPISALAGILMVIAFKMFDFGIIKLLRFPGTRLDFLIIAAVIATAIVFGLIQAAGLGVGLAIFVFIRDQVRSSVLLRRRDLRHLHSSRRRSEEEMRLLEQHGSDGLVVELRDNLFFGTTDQLFSELEPELARTRFILLDLRRVASVDYTAAHLFEQFRHRLGERNGRLLLCGLPSVAAARQDITRYLQQMGLIGEDQLRVFDTRDSALEWMERHILADAGWSEPSSNAPLSLLDFSLFEGIAADCVAPIAAVTASISLKSGEVLFHRGDVGDSLYLVRRGLIHASLPLEGGQRHHLATFGAGELLGELAFLDRQARSADVHAETSAELFVLSRQRFDLIEREHPALAAQIFERLAHITCQRLRQADKDLQALEER